MHIHHHELEREGGGGYVSGKHFYFFNFFSSINQQYSVLHKDLLNTPASTPQLFEAMLELELTKRSRLPDLRLEVENIVNNLKVH